MLFRLSKSKYRNAFILKGALLLELWTKERYRATRDAHFLAKGDNSPERFIRTGSRLLTYPRGTFVSEKLEAMVKLGIANSRMKDFHDLHSLSKAFEFDGKTLVDAVRVTFKRRGTAWPEGGTPLAFTPEFYDDENKIKQWKAFCSKNKPRVQDIEFKTLIARVSSFLLPVIKLAQTGRNLNNRWTPNDQWQPPPHI
jgi:hypothetical protein